VATTNSPVPAKALVGTAQFALYIAVGVLNTAFGFGVYTLAIYLGLHYTIAALVSQVLGTGFNYITYGSLVFRQRPRKSSFARFILSYAVLYGFSLLDLTLLQGLGLNAYVAGLVNSAVMPALSYLSNRFLVFRAPKDGGS
jgi:putative flippase GtrA